MQVYTVYILAVVYKVYNRDTSLLANTEYSIAVLAYIVYHIATLSYMMYHIATLPYMCTT